MTPTAQSVLAAALFVALAVGAWVLARKLRRLRSMLRRQERHVWETQNIFRVMAGDAPLPQPGAWAASTDLLGELLRDIASRQPQRVVELGSGLSTLVIAAALRRNGCGRLVSIEADADYGQHTVAQLRLHALHDWADVRIAPLKTLHMDDDVRPWYDVAALEDLRDIDLLFIDGPPTRLRRDIRYPALPFFWPQLTPGAVVLLDDAARPGERAITRQWQQRFSQARYEFLRLEKGALRITRPSSSPPEFKA